MSDARRRRKAKQARRDARRTKSRDHEDSGIPEEVPLADEVREAVTGHPVDLLGLVSMIIEATRPDPVAFLRPDSDEKLDLRVLVESFIGVRTSETTALLAVLAELLVDDDKLRLNCRRELATRNDDLPQWLADLGRASAYRAVRMSHVLGDGDEVIIGVRFTDGAELTCAVFIDHNMATEVKDAFLVPDSIDSVLAVGARHNTDPDSSFTEMSLADARAWVHDSLAETLVLPADESDTWPACRALVEWIISGLPDGGDGYHEPDWDEHTLTGLLDSFFGSLPGMPFDDDEHRNVLVDFCLASGSGDPLRWSAGRVEQVLYIPPGEDEDIAAEFLLDTPDLLRAYIPFAHAQSDIRDGLTAEALAVIDDMQGHYRDVVKRHAVTEA